MLEPKIVDSVDVSDVCADIDSVVLSKDGHNYRAAPFVEEQHGYREVDVKLTDYPAIVSVARRAFETPRPITFEQPEQITATRGNDVD